MAALDSFQKLLMVLFLLGLANTLPIAARKLFGKRWETPVDFGVCWFDDRPLFGPHKTWRGLVASLAGTTLVAAFTPVGAVCGLGVAFLSMAGDLIASFIKRRMGLGSGAKSLGIDQGVEAILPLAVLKGCLYLSWTEVILLTFLFAISELCLSPLLYRLGFRRNPY